MTPGPGATFPYPPTSPRRCARWSPIPPPRAGRSTTLERAVTDAHVAAVEAFMQRFDLARERIALVGLHGQTVLHRPGERFTRQLMRRRAREPASGHRRGQ